MGHVKGNLPRENDTRWEIGICMMEGRAPEKGQDGAVVRAETFWKGPPGSNGRGEEGYVSWSLAVPPARKLISSYMHRWAPCTYVFMFQQTAVCFGADLLTPLGCASLSASSWSSSTASRTFYGFPGETHACMVGWDTCMHGRDTRACTAWAAC